MIIVENVDLTPREQYEEYLKDHRDNVRRAFDLIKDKIDDAELRSEVSTLIMNHDQSKYSPEEFEPYMVHFYTDEDNEDIFNCAWNHHQKVNPHHWQYWIITKDSGKQFPLEMMDKYVLEMLCDWHSFSFKNPESTCQKWYEDNKDKMVLADSTVDKIEKYLKLFGGKKND